MSVRLRIVVASLAVLVAFLGVTAAGYVYINHVAAGIAGVPVMFGRTPAASPAHTPAAPR